MLLPITDEAVSSTSARPKSTSRNCDLFTLCRKLLGCEDNDKNRKVCWLVIHSN